MGHLGVFFQGYHVFAWVLPREIGCGSKLKSKGYARFGLWFHLPRCHFGMHVFKIQPFCCLTQLGPIECIFYGLLPFESLIKSVKCIISLGMVAKNFVFCRPPVKMTRTIKLKSQKQTCQEQRRYPKSPALMMWGCSSFFKTSNSCWQDWITAASGT